MTIEVKLDITSPLIPKQEYPWIGYRDGLLVLFTHPTEWGIVLSDQRCMPLLFGDRISYTSSMFKPWYGAITITSNAD